ncbi:disintegrin domain-containing protein [Nephila pilipes]|uniref:Disintegrin domain-containing protein n=1 Tax=Nephila pilipes TaxID=299642 RepID=A0A8X6MF47_NEPPI|nr:disintegrin domain-containing protein [Nephila pilipes]
MSTNYFIYFSCILCVHALLSSKVHGHEGFDETKDKTHHADDTSQHEGKLELLEKSNQTKHEENVKNLTTNNDSKKNLVEEGTTEGISESGNENNKTFAAHEILERIEKNDTFGKTNDTSNGAGQTENLYRISKGPRLDGYPPDDDEASSVEDYYPNGIYENKNSNYEGHNDTEVHRNHSDVRNEKESTEKNGQPHDKSSNRQDKESTKAISDNFTENSNLSTNEFDIAQLVEAFKKEKTTQKIIRDPVESNTILLLKDFNAPEEVILGILKPFVIWPNVVIMVQNKSEEKKISDLEDLSVYEGSLKSVHGSYVCGSIVNDSFTGVILFEDGSVMYVGLSKNENAQERSNLYGKRDQEIEPSNSHSCKKEEEKILCFESKKKENKRNNLNFVRSGISDLPKNHHNQRHHNHSEEHHACNSSCSVELVSDASHFVDVHKGNVAQALREIILITMQANHTLNQVDLDEDGTPDSISLKIESIVMNATKENGNSSGEEKVMNKKIEMFQNRLQSNCISILLLGEQLTEDEPVSIAYEGIPIILFCNSN